MKSRLPHVILAAVLCSGAARSVEPPRDGIHDDARAFGAQTRQVLAWEIVEASARAGCAFWVSVDSYNGSGRNIRRHARDLRRAWSGDADAVLLAYERSSNQLGFSFSPGLWEKHTPAALAVLVHEAGASMSRTDTSLEERLSGAVSVLLEGMRRLEEGRIRSARPLSIADRRLAVYFTPVLAAGAREIGQGNFGYRIEPETADEFGRLVDAFNTMAGELELSRAEVQRKGREVEGRGRYIETILKRIATGVISLDQSGRINTMNSAAARLLGLDQSAVGQMFDDVFARQDLRPLLSIPQGAARTRGGTAGHEITLVRDGRDLHLAVAATPLRDEGASVGTVLVFDDVTPLIRAQRVSAWRDVARRLAHEIKNPLTPIQLSAERLRRHFSAAPPATRELVDECSTNIVGAVESLKGLVDEFSQFARMPAPKAVPSDLHVLLDEALALYAGLPRVTVVREYDAAMPVIRVDPEQFKRVVINLVDNAVEALASERDGLPASAQGTISVQTTWDESHRLARLVVSDNGPGLGVADRSKVFLPYYSTKGRDSGLGLAIVRRVIVEHGGTIEVSDHAPRGAAFTMELPA